MGLLHLHLELSGRAGLCVIGLTAVNREGVELGKVDSLMESGAHDLLVIKGKREVLIPFVEHFVGKVDVAAGRIEVDWGEDY